MTANQSTIRLVLYVAATMATAASAGITTVNFDDPKQVWIFGLSVLATGLTTARSYIDKSPAEIKQ